MTNNPKIIPDIPYQFTMSVRHKYFEMIKTGKKDIELRAYDEKRKKVKIGDKFQLFDAENPDQSIICEVLNMHIAPDFEKLFCCLYKLLHRDITFLNHPINLSSVELNRLDTIKQYPLQISYVILICLFTGTRACGAITIRHQDVDCCNKTITISRNETIIQQGDTRETYKKLKTDDSERKIPIAIVLEELGLIDYIKQHEQKYGSRAFIFEEVIQNKTKQGYRPKVMNECVNVLFKVINIKPKTTDKFMLDMHSLKESFYSHNEMHISRDMLEAIAGNKPSNKSISSRVYNKQSFTRLPTV